MSLADFVVPQPDYSASPMVSTWVSGLVFIAVAIGLLIAWNQLRDADQRSRHETGELWEKSKLAAELAKPISLIPVPDVEPEPTEPEPVEPEPEPEPAVEPERELVLAGRHADPREAADIGYVGRRYANTDGDTQVIRSDGSWPA